MTNILTSIHFSQKQIKQLERLPNVHVIAREDYDPTQAKIIDVIMAWHPVAADIMSAPNNVHFIQTTSAGVDYLPLQQLADDHVLVANASGIHADAIAESVLGYVLDFARYITHPTNRDPDNFWYGRTHRRVLYQLPGKRAVIIGAGHVGTAISTLLHKVGMITTGVNHDGHSVAGFDHTVSLVNLNTATANADFIINTLPLTPETHHFYDQKFFSAQTNHPVFINVGRGPSVDENALIAALNNGQLRGAALDVFETEPLPATSPLWQAPNLIMTPHTTGTVDNVEDAVFAIFYPNMLQFLEDGTLAVNQVNLLRGY